MCVNVYHIHMGREWGLAISPILLGVGLLYIGWANAGGLIPPFALCGYVGESMVHLGGNFALVYSGGCAPFEFAHLVFVLVTITGIWSISGSLHFEPQSR